MNIYNLVSFSGIFVLLGFACLISSNRRKMNWRVIGWGIALQMLFATFIFCVPAGARLFLLANDVVLKVLDSASAGTKFIFGRLALPPGTLNQAGEDISLGPILAFQVFPAIIFFSALMSVLYYFKIMPLIIRGFAYVFTRLMKISGAESLCAASNIFVGIESALTIKPHLSDMTRSELCTILSVGMATVASSVMLVYVSVLKSQFPNIAAHLISASILSAPAALIMSKILLPESEVPKTLGKTVRLYYEKENSLFEAIINGANAGVKLVIGIVALLLAVLGLVALVNLFLGAIGGRINSFLELNINWSLEGILGYVFYPFTAILGVPVQDISTIARIIGERMIVTEMTAYQDLAGVLDKIHPRSAVIATYALCGFAHVASLAIFVGGVSALAPSRARDLAEVGVRALAAATLACLLTACVAGMFPMGTSILLGSLG